MKQAQYLIQARNPLNLGERNKVKCQACTNHETTCLTPAGTTHAPAQWEFAFSSVDRRIAVLPGVHMHPGHSIMNL